MLGVLWSTAIQQTNSPIKLTEGLAIESVSRSGRSPVVMDAIEDRRVRGAWTTPVVGETVTGPSGDRKWSKIVAGEDGSFTGPALRGGYVRIHVPSTTEKAVVLHAVGHNFVYVNGELRAGDPYGFGYVRLPIQLQKGNNELLFSVGRGRLTAEIEVASSTPTLLNADLTLPDVVIGEYERLLGSIPVMNPLSQTAGGLQIRTTVGDRTLTSSTFSLSPLTTRKIGFELPSVEAKSSGEATLKVELIRASDRSVLSEQTFKINVRKPNEMHRRTFRSQIDGSVQYYAVQPSSKPGRGQALVLSVHGASVEATSQANAYGQKSWAHIICPTNRRPFGFDWEEWGRMDALEVLEDARKRYETSPDHTYLTGHSMGGHGTWQLGVTFPDRFAAIGPSAGWISFFTYAGGRKLEEATGVEAMLNRATAGSDTLNRIRNLARTGVYIVHSDQDESVPVGQAREMAKQLGEFHKDWQYFEKPGQGHWWDDDDEPGASCVDWPPMFDMFSRRKLAPQTEVRFVDFVTVNPAMSSRCDWLEVMQQQQSLVPSRAKFRFDPLNRKFTGTTENIQVLRFDLTGVSTGEVTFEIDGKITKAAWPAATQNITFRREGDGWQVVDEVPATEKTPERSGPLKEAMTREMVLVYGTKGTAAENAWAYQKARYDAEQFWVRGNGSIEIVADSALTSAYADRTVVLYGNADTNGQWSNLLGNSPIRVDRKAVTVGARSFPGSFAASFVRPKRGTTNANVVVFAGTDIVGARSLDRYPIFTSGAAYPDWSVVSSDLYKVGAPAFRAVGFFGQDWQLSESDSAYR